MTVLARCIAAALALLLPAQAFAHKPSDAYLRLHVDGANVSGRWDIALRDLDAALHLDRDDDGAITWREVRTREADIARLALESLRMSTERRACALDVKRLAIDRHADGAYASLEIAGDCGHAPATLAVGYTLFGGLDAGHRGLLRLSAGSHDHGAILSAAQGTTSFELARGDAGRLFGEYFTHGAWHIWLGFDHLLFLASLLLPAVLVRDGGAWRARSGWRESLRDLAGVVTAFTVAHSITLAAAAFGWVALPSRWVESAIALSVVLASLNNVFPLVPARRWAMAFGFGLVHGLGFASVLAELGLPRDSAALALFAFNVGVEAGQLAVVAAFFPLAFAWRERPFYRRVVLTGGSLATAALACAWLAERALDVRLLGGVG